MKQLTQIVITACEHFNIEKVVISPGSRNAPLTIGFSNHSNIKAYSIVDERCAAFFAMGMAQQTKKPVAMVCTSGSALLNYYPAIAEAYYSKIPLIVITADRPKHLINIGDGQTINQENVYQNHILFSANLVEDTSFTQQNVKLIANAIITAKTKKGPVHINVPFDEPLYNVEDLPIQHNYFKDIKKNNTPVKNIDYQKFSDIWNAANKKLILVGVHFPSEKLQQVLNNIANDDTVLVMTETTSNLYNDLFINSIDKLITKLDESEFKKLQPEVLLTFGGLVVSKRIKQFLRKYQPTHHWHIDEHTKLDTYFCLSEFVEEDPTRFLSALNPKIKNTENRKTTYRNYWFNEKEKRTQQHQKFLAKAPYSDLKVFESVLDSIPDNCQLQISNSSVIRYTQLFDLNASLHVFCNRGTSGIDGSTSTAIGASVGHEKQTIFITGDISFFYDSNALWNNYIPKNFRLILINNNGGGIFKIIPGPKSSNALQYFETPHNLTAVHLAKMYDFEYISVQNYKTLKSELKDFYTASNKPKILEICTPSDKNDVILQEYFKYL